MYNMNENTSWEVISVFEIVGRYNHATVYAEMVDKDSFAQILRMCNNEKLKGSRIRMMPDTHASAGCTVGTSLTFDDRVNPSFVGDDIGCGMQVYELADRNIDFAELDKTIRESIPSGPRIFDHAISQIKNVPLDSLHCFDFIRYDTVKRSFGTLGGGNHFIEVDKAADGRLYLVIHSGSRRLGRDVAGFHNAAAFFCACGIDPKEAARKKLRPGEIKSGCSLGECFLSGGLLEEYLNDMKIAVNYAAESRKAMGEAIISRMKLHPVDSFTTIHNYIDTENKILRKGAVSAQEGETIIIPINMKDGALICRGRGNVDWNYTAPHGSGRVLRRSEAKELITLDEFKAEMEGVFTTSVNESTIDESPMAYRRVDEILNVIDPTAEVVERILPVYNFKASRPVTDEDTMDGED